MSQISMADRLAVKTPGFAFQGVLEQEFNFSKRVAQEVLNVAQEMLVGRAGPEAIQPGQIRLVVVSLKAPFGPPLAESEKKTVTLTVDTGVEDEAVKEEQGVEAQRQGRILRILDEALEQGGVLTQEDLAKALGVSRRTIGRDVKALQAEGHLVHTRGQVQGVGRGQTHKVRILELWLDRESYSKISRWVHHSEQAIKRYVRTFKQVVVLHRKEVGVTEIAFLTNISPRLAKDYLVVYETALEQPHRREKLGAELHRTTGQPLSITEPEKKQG